MNQTKFRCFTCQTEVDVLGLCPQCLQKKEARGLTRYMLEEKRQHIMENVKAPLSNALVKLSKKQSWLRKGLLLIEIIRIAKRLKIQPTKHNTQKPNTHTLIDIWKEFLEMEDNPCRDELFGALGSLTEAENEHDAYYEFRGQVIFELWLKHVLKGNWQPRTLDYRLGCWKETQRGIGYHFVKRCYEDKTFRERMVSELQI